MNLEELDVEPEYDPAAPLSYLEKAATAPDADRVRLAVRAIRAMLATGADVGVLAEARACVKRTKPLDLASFDALVREAKGSEPASPDAASAATVLVQIAQEHYTFGISETGDPFALPNDGPKVVAMLRGGKTSLRALLAREYFTRTGRAAAQQALADALLVIEGIAQDAEESRLYLRTAQHDGHLLLDLGDHTGRTVRITAAGWSMENVSPVLFKRTALTAALPVPEPGGKLDALWAWLNVAEADRPLVAAELVARLFSDQPHVVLALFGEHGTGKTTALKVLVQLIDPSPVPVRKAPRDADSWVTAAAGSWVVGLDNLSDIPGWLSDSLCRASTGDGDVRRKLYTDGDYAVFSFRRCVIFSAIDVGALAPDLADRALPVTLMPIPDEHRQDEESFWAAWQEEHPALLGAVLDLAAAVLRRLPGIRLDRKPRMADFARILAAVDAELGTDALKRYGSTAADLAADSLSGDPFAVRLQEHFAQSGFSGTSAELLAKLTPEDDMARLPKGWPKDGRAVTTRMHKIAPALRKLGWALGESKDGHSKLLRWTFSPPARPEIARGDTRSSPQPPQDAGIAVVSGDEAGPSQDVRQEKNAGLCTICGEPLSQEFIDAGFTDHGEDTAA